MILTNDVLSDFRYDGCIILDFQIDNNIFVVGNDLTSECNLQLAASNIVLSPDQSRKAAHLKLTVKGDFTSAVSQGAKFSFSMALDGAFSSPATLSDQDFRNMLFLNGTATLYGIARSKIEVFSSLSFHSGKISLPLLNVVEFLNKQQSDSNKVENSST